MSTAFMDQSCSGENKQKK